MSTFIGEIKLFAGPFVPQGWLSCEGQILAITDYTGLAGLIDNYYGGNGTSTFALPDLRGRVPIGQGSGSGLTPRIAGQSGGMETVSLLLSQMPAHNHAIANTATGTATATATATATTTNTLTVASSATLKCSDQAGNTTDPSDNFLSKPNKANGDQNYTSNSADATSTMDSSVVGVDSHIAGDIKVDVDVDVNEVDLNVGVESTCSMTGNGYAHENMQPWICMQYIINYDGVFPNRT